MSFEEPQDVLKTTVPQLTEDAIGWVKCRTPFWPRRTIDGGWTHIPSGQAWRRKVKGKWQYKRDEKSKS